MNAMQPPQSVEEIKAGLETTEKGGVRQSIRNCLTVFQRDPLLSGAIAYNILTDRKDIIKPIGFHRESTALNDTDMKYLLLYLEETYGLTNEKKIDNAIGIVANENKYHPIRDYLNTLVWDGTERIRFCLRHFLGADADDYTYEALKLFLLGAISRAFQPGCKFEIMLCLVGGQGAGKSTFFRLLAVRDEWFSDDLRKLDDDNVYRKLQGHWIIEMSEMMATVNAKSIEDIKSFISRQKETYKIPYETHPEDRPRQCVFVGTSNNMDFLPLDRTGNRRFAPVLVHPERVEKHILEDEKESREYIRQAWAEAMELYRNGSHELKLSRETEEYLKEMQKDILMEKNYIQNNGKAKGKIYIGLDHGYGNIKTAHRVFTTGVEAYDEEPIVSTNVVKYRDKYYVIGESHLVYQGNKTDSEDFYILTLAGLAEELKFRGLHEAEVVLAVGLPLAWVKSQAADWRAYLMQEKELDFMFQKERYKVHLCGVEIFPQGLAAVHNQGAMPGMNMLVDIGNGTMSILEIHDGRPIEKSISTEVFGVHHCMEKIQKELSKRGGVEVPEMLIEPLLRNGIGERTDNVAMVTKRIAESYTEEIMKKLAAHGYKEDLVHLYIIGGGGCLLRHFSDLTEKGNVTVISDICANAKGYEALAEMKQRMRGKTA